MENTWANGSILKHLNFIDNSYDITFIESIKSHISDFKTQHLDQQNQRKTNLSVKQKQSLWHQDSFLCAHSGSQDKIGSCSKLNAMVCIENRNFNIQISKQRNNFFVIKTPVHALQRGSVNYNHCVWHCTPPLGASSSSSYASLLYCFWCDCTATSQRSTSSMSSVIMTSSLGGRSLSSWNIRCSGSQCLSGNST